MSTRKVALCAVHVLGAIIRGSPTRDLSQVTGRRFPETV